MAFTCKVPSVLVESWLGEGRGDVRENFLEELMWNLRLK